MSWYHRVILKPIVNEKSLKKVTDENKYTFLVETDANKVLIKSSIEHLFNVNVIKINVIKIKGKVKKFKNIPGKQNDKKKAIVELKKGQTIDVFKNLK